jgi:peptidoglycan/xylan/chitin deacetylase (PgdA/CDA1 family)
MPGPENANRGRRAGLGKRVAIWLPILVLVLAACAPPSQVRPPAELIAVPVGPGDTLDELARRHLGKADRSWIIRDFNNIDSVTEGQRLLIPRHNYRPGGLAPDGYQVVPVLAYPDLATVKSEQASRIVDRFRSQMQYLQTRGYHVVDIHQLTEFIAFHATLPPRAVVLTFDDQSRLFYDLIFPILKDLQFSGTLFIRPAAVGAESMATWSQLNEMSASGVAIQCRWDPKLNAALKAAPFPDRARLEQIAAALRRDREMIATSLNQPCQFLAYPGGEVSVLAILLADKAGFSAALDQTGGSNPFYRHPFMIHRQPVAWEADIAAYRKHLEIFEHEALR